MIDYLKPEAQLSSASDVRRFILGGKAIFTLQFRDGSHTTYKVQSAKRESRSNWSTGNQDKTRYFVSALYGSDNANDYFYIGMIFRESNGRNNFAATAKSGAKPGSIVFDRFNLLWQTLESTNSLPEVVRFFHAGRCGFCGRLLTHPESLASGIGPECSGKG